jgi:hypothetical protein
MEHQKAKHHSGGFSATGTRYDACGRISGKNHFPLVVGRLLAFQVLGNGAPDLMLDLGRDWKCPLIEQVVIHLRRFGLSGLAGTKLDNPFPRFVPLRTTLLMPFLSASFVALLPPFVEALLVTDIAASFPTTRVSTA